MNYCVVHNAERKASKNLSYVNIPEHLKISILKIILNLESVFWLNVSGRWNISRGLLKECAMHRVWNRKKLFNSVAVPFYKFTKLAI